MGRAEVVGGGIAGLAAAASLAQQGWQVRLHERADELRAFGAGIYLYENGLKVLARLGCMDEAIEGASLAHTREVRGADGAVLARHGWGSVGRVYAVTRQRLIGALSAAATRAGAEIITASSGVAATADGRLTLSSGAREADLIVAADGINSPIRDSLPIRVRRRSRPDGAIRVLVPKSEAERAAGDTGTTIEAWSGTRRILLTPTSEEEIYLALTMLDTDEVAKKVPIDQPSWQAAFPDFADLVARVGDQGRYDQFEILRLDRWSAGRVAVIGDAAHAMPPNIGQGGGCSMMNALSLACHVTGAVDLSAALEQWERTERPLTEHTQRISLFLSRPALWPKPIQRRFFAFAGRSAIMERLRTRTARHVPTGT